MLIENPDAFKSWLTSILEPLCDADPAALAKYVYALVKKDKPLEELRDGMLDQLDVFLQQETKPFVELLFKSLETHDYLTVVIERKATPPLEQLPPLVQLQEPDLNGAEPSEEAPPMSGGAGAAETRSPPPACAPRHRVVLNRAPPVRHVAVAPPTRAPPHEQTLVKVLPLNELLEEPIDQPRRRDRRSDSLKDKDERRRRRSRSWERSRRQGRPQRAVWRNSSPPHHPNNRYEKRSRSPIQVRDRERDRASRERERDRISRDRDHRERVSRSREREREPAIRERSRERSRGSAGTPTQDSNPGEAGAAPAAPPSLAAIFKRRCRDFDEKGYCMRGDLCQWDHGTDPVVLEDPAIGLSRVLTMPPPVPEYNPLAPDIWGAPPFPFPPHQPPHHLSHPPRELIPIPRVREAMAPAIVLAQPPVPGLPPPPRALPPPPPPPHPHPTHHHHHHHSHQQHNKAFDYNRLGPMRQGGNNAVNCSLEVKKVPRGMNDITHLNNHFGKFGRIVNIQVCYEGDQEAALITFSSHTEANVAYKSTEAVLNNRFIKVFWHNPESKQENIPPGGNNNQSTNPPHVNPPSHAGSHNKVLINNRTAAEPKKPALDNGKAPVKPEQPLKEGAEVKPAVVEKETKQKQVSDMHKRAQTLLQTQLQQQMLLIQRLETGNVTEAQKEALMEAIKSAQEGIEKLRKELLAYSKLLEAARAGAIKKPKTREEAQKEILDAELDLFTKQQEGQDVTDLLKRVAELRRQMAVQFPTHVPSRRGISRGARFNTSTRYSRTAAAAPKVYVNQSVDHRPRALLISGFESDEIDAVVQHFSQFGEIVGKDLNAAVPELVLQFRARQQAEQASARGKHYNDRTLSITWSSGASVKPIPSTPPTPTAAMVQPTLAPPLVANGAAQEDKEQAGLDKNKAAVAMAEDALLRDDEEEDEDSEERSWRR